MAFLCYSVFITGDGGGAGARCLSQERRRIEGKYFSPLHFRQESEESKWSPSSASFSSHSEWVQILPQSVTCLEIWTRMLSPWHGLLVLGVTSNLSPKCPTHPAVFPVSTQLPKPLWWPSLPWASFQCLHCIWIPRTNLGPLGEEAGGWRKESSYPV